MAFVHPRSLMNLEMYDQLLLVQEALLADFALQFIVLYGMTRQMSPVTVG